MITGTHNAHIKPPRYAALEAAKSQRAAAVKVLVVAEEAKSRLQAVINFADDAARAAADATRAATDARTQWVHMGCVDPTEHQKLAIDAKAEGVFAQEASVDATAARRGIPAATTAVRDAESAIKAADGRIDDAIGHILLARFQAKCDRALEVAAELHQLKIELRAFLEGAGGLSLEASRQVQQVLRECEPKSISDYACTAAGTHVSSPPDSVLQIAARLRQEAQVLRS